MARLESSPTVPISDREDQIHPTFITPRDPNDPVQLAGYHRPEDLFNWLVRKIKHLPDRNPSTDPPSSS